MSTQSGEGRTGPCREERHSTAKGRALRIRRSSEFSDLFRDGSKRVGRCMILWVRRSPKGDKRVGVVASKRTFPRAVDRSRAKRLMREAFRLRVDELPPCDVVCVARRSILNLRCAEVERDLMHLLRVRPAK